MLYNSDGIKGTKMMNFSGVVAAFKGGRGWTWQNLRDIFAKNKGSNV